MRSDKTPFYHLPGLSKGLVTTIDRRSLTHGGSDLPEQIVGHVRLVNNARGAMADHIRLDIPLDVAACKDRPDPRLFLFHSQKSLPAIEARQTEVHHDDIDVVLVTPVERHGLNAVVRQQDTVAFAFE